MRLLHPADPFSQKKMSFFGGDKPKANFHRGALRCECAHALGDVHWPLDSSTVHSNTVTESHGKCVWQCCGQGWSNALCTVLVVEPAAPRVAPKAAPPATVTYDSAIYGKSMSIVLHPRDIAAEDEAKRLKKVEEEAAAAEAEKAKAALEAAEAKAKEPHHDEHDHKHGHEHGDEHGGHGEHEHKAPAEEGGFLALPSFGLDGMPSMNIDPMAGLALFNAKEEEPEEEKSDKVKRTHGKRQNLKLAITKN